MRLRTLVDTADVAAYARAHEGHHPRLDRGLQLLTRAADFSALWIGTAGLLAATQGRSGRRAAVRGLLSIALTSGVVNGPLKSAARRPRPDNRLLPAGRARYRRTRTSSFPSGHAASAAAFAVGASTELPRAALPLGVTAALVGASRVRVGAHYPGDVLAGFAAGAAVASATRRVWPVPPVSAQLGCPGSPRPDQERATGKGVSLVVNAQAGPTDSSAPQQALKERFPGLRVVEVVDDDLDRALRQAAEGAEVLGIAGGDGSVNAAATLALERDLPLLVVPAGTLNHFARDIGLETVDEVAEALERGAVAEVDVALVADQVFLNTASIGWYAELVNARERLEHRVGKWPAVLLAMSYVLRSKPPLEVEIDGRRRRVWMVFFGNCRYRPAGFTPSWRERLDDGLVDVRVVDAAVPGARARLVAAVLTGSLGRSRTYEQRTAEAVTVRSLDGALRVSRDGEVADGPDELVVRKADRRLRVYARPPG